MIWEHGRREGMGRRVLWHVVIVRLMEHVWAMDLDSDVLAAMLSWTVAFALLRA